MVSLKWVCDRVEKAVALMGLTEVQLVVAWYWMMLPLRSMMTVGLSRLSCLLLGFASLNPAYMALKMGKNEEPRRKRTGYRN